MDQGFLHWTTGMVKNLYKGTFSFSHEMIIKRVYAYSGRQAKVMMMRRLARDHGVSYSTVFAMFDGSRANFSIEPEIIFKETED
jgi:hypothetical protein